MEFNWSYSLELYKELINLSENQKDINTIESLARMIINRCYYSSFNLLSQHLKKEGIYEYDKKNPKKDSHSELAEKLNDFKDSLDKGNKKKRYSRIIPLLYTLKKNRIRADYNNIILPNPIIEANSCIYYAEKIFYYINAIENNLVYNWKLE